MRKLLALVLLLSAVMEAAQQTPAVTPDVIAAYKVRLHEQLSATCELISTVTLIQYKQYDALALAGGPDEIYSPELGKADFVAVPSVVAKDVTKSAKKSGFDVRTETPTEPFGQSAEPILNGSSCPSSQQAIADARNRRHERSVKEQSRVHFAGSSGVLPPVPIQQAQPQRAANPQSTQSVENPKIKEGTAMLMMVVGVDGTVHDVHVVRSLDVALDQMAIEAVQKWRFSPARMKGLPVPAQIGAEIDFHRH